MIEIKTRKCRYCGKEFKVVIDSPMVLWCSYECAKEDTESKK